MSNDDRVQYKFMIPSALKVRIEDAAHENRRSVSAEIVATLEANYPDLSPIREMLARMSEAIAAMEAEGIKPAAESGSAPRSEREREYDFLVEQHRRTKNWIELSPYPGWPSKD